MRRVAFSLTEEVGAELQSLASNVSLLSAFSPNENQEATGDFRHLNLPDWDEDSSEFKRTYFSRESEDLSNNGSPDLQSWKSAQVPPQPRLSPLHQGNGAYSSRQYHRLASPLPIGLKGVCSSLTLCPYFHSRRRLHTSLPAAVDDAVIDSDALKQNKKKSKSMVPGELSVQFS